MAVLLHPLAPDGCEMFADYMNIGEPLFSWDKILMPLSAYVPDITKHELKFLEPKTDFFKKPLWQLTAQEKSE